jgi:hypothetical protein
MKFYRLWIGYKHFSNRILLNCGLHTDVQFIELHEVLEDCSSAVYCVYSHFMCRVIQQDDAYEPRNR